VGASVLPVLGQRLAAPNRRSVPSTAWGRDVVLGQRVLKRLLNYPRINTLLTHH
jgi:hypothetical protein